MLNMNRSNEVKKIIITDQLKREIIRKYVIRDTSRKGWDFVA